jgi:hypothetical protein
MGLNDFLAVFYRDVCVPGAFRVDDNHWPIAALVKTACLVNADAIPQSPLGDLIFQSLKDSH